MLLVICLYYYYRNLVHIQKWSNHLHSLCGRSHQHSRQTRIFCSLLRRRPPDLRPLTLIFLFESGSANVELCRRDRQMDGQQLTQAQPFKDGVDLAWIQGLPEPSSLRGSTLGTSPVEHQTATGCESNRQLQL